MDRYLKNGFGTENASPAVRKLLDECGEGDVLHLGGGTLHFYPEGAETVFAYISNNDPGSKPTAFPVIGKKALTVDGDGAKMIFHGNLLPFLILRSENVTLRNFTVSTPEPAYFAGRIEESGEDFVELVFDPEKYHCEIADGRFVFSGEGWEHSRKRVLVNEFDPETKGPVPCTPTYFACLDGKRPDENFLSSLNRYLTASKPAPGRIRLEGKLGFCHTVGKYWLCTHGSREFPGIFSADSRGIRIENVTLRQTLSMGVICQNCEEVTLEAVTAIPEEDRLLSCCADATHFVNCRGLVSLKNCRFESMMDDAGNIHGIYYPVTGREGERTLLLGFGHSQQRGVNVFQPGDTVRTVDNRTLLPTGSYTVRKSTLLSENALLLETAEPLPDGIPAGTVIENVTAMPEVRIENCISGFNRPRGFLLSTNRTATVENSSFYNISSAIEIDGDANSWFESGHAGTVILRDNRFDNAAYSGGAVIGAYPQIPERTGKPYHGTLIVENNFFRLNGKRFLNVTGFGRVVFRDNVFLQDGTLPLCPPVSESGVLLNDCEETEISLPEE